MNTENEKNAKVDEVIKDPVMNNLVKLVKILCESRERQVKRNQKDTRRFKDIEKKGQKIEEKLKDIVEVKVADLLDIIDNVDEKVENLEKTVMDLKKMVKEQQETIFKLKYPSLA